MSNDAFVRDLLADRSLCGPCIARKAEMKVSGVYEAMARIGRTRKTRMTVGRCAECQWEAIIHAIG